jgi:signal transduction histidine kinase
MNERVIASSSIPRTVRRVEWMVLIVHFLVIPCLLLLNRNVTYPESLIPRWMVFFSLAGCALLSFFFPIDCSLWQRRLYIGLEILLILPAILMGWGLQLLLYLVFAKSCFLLKQKDVIFVVIITGIVWHFCEIHESLVRAPQTIEFLRLHAAQIYEPQRIIFGIIINNGGLYLAASIFVILFSYVTLAEQKSRQQAEALMKEIETLAARLERTRIARDIHDSLGHSLTALNVQLELAQRLHSQDPGRAFQVLDTAKNLASQAFQEARRAVSTMREKDFELKDAIASLIKPFQQNQSWKIKINWNLPPLPLQTSHQLYCIVQEGLTNIQRHSRATQVELCAQTMPTEIILEIIDDGVGFDRRALNSGFGLRGMQERVQMLGGQIQIASTPGLGTRIQVKIPYLDEKRSR